MVFYTHENRSRASIYLGIRGLIAAPIKLANSQEGDDKQGADMYYCMASREYKEHKQEQLGL